MHRFSQYEYINKESKMYNRNVSINFHFITEQLTWISHEIISYCDQIFKITSRQILNWAIIKMLETNIVSNACKILHEMSVD